MQRAVSIVLIAIIFRLPEAAAAATNVPVGCVVQEWQHRTQCIRDIISIHVALDFCYQLMQATDDPNIQRVRQLAQRIFQFTIKFPAINFRIHREEIVHIPDHTELARHIAHILIVQSKVLAVQQRATQQ